MADPNSPPSTPANPRRRASDDNYRRGPFGGDDGFGGWIWHILGGGLAVMLILYTLLMRCWCVCHSLKHGGCDDNHKHENGNGHGNGHGNGKGGQRVLAMEQPNVDADKGTPPTSPAPEASPPAPEASPPAPETPPPAPEAPPPTPEKPPPAPVVPPPPPPPAAVAPQPAKADSPPPPADESEPTSPARVLGALSPVFLVLFFALVIRCLSRSAPAEAPDAADAAAAAAVVETVKIIKKTCFNPDKVKKW